MSDIAHIKVLLMLLLALAFVAALVFGRRRRLRNQDDLRTRYVKARGLCIAYGIILGLDIVVTFHRHGQSWLSQLWMPICFGLCFGIFFFQFLKARKKFLGLPASKRQKSRRPPPAFFWQAILILLPVALMAGFGFWALLRERNAVEHDAQQRAREILQSLPGEFGRMTANRLTFLEATKGGWYRYLEDFAAWPQSSRRKQRLENTNEQQTLARELADLHAAIPAWQEGPVPLVSFYLNTNGHHSFGSAVNFQPPAWLATMSAGQLQAWTELQAAARDAAPFFDPARSKISQVRGEVETSMPTLEGTLKAFQATAPPPDALACAELLQLRTTLPTLAATNAIAQLMGFAGNHYEQVSEAGVPLRTLALAEALRLARECGPTEKLWEQLQSEVSQPSALTSILLDEAARLVATNAELSAAVKAMRILHADKLAQAELAEAVQQTGKLNGITTTNLWLDALGERWFCILSPSELRSGTSFSNRPVWTNYAITQVQCYPKFLVARGFAEALADAKVSLPTYFSLALELEAEPVPLTAPWSDFANGRPSGDVLAAENFQMFQPAMRMKENSNGGPQEETMFEAMPGHPKFSLQIRLTDRNLLFARQHRLQFVFGALIAASAMAALIGFVAAYRAFRREQMLGEMKSNFVSSVSHELRAPIASVRLMAENLERGKIAGSEKQGEYFRFIVQECRRLSSLIENVLDFSRIEQGRKQYDFEPTDVAALVETTVKLMEPYAAEKGVRLEIKSEIRNPKSEMDVDGRAIQQALVNLIDNAVKHSPKGETVMVEIRNPKSEIRNQNCPLLCLSVTDRGPGIPAAEHEKIFERFYRLGSELRRETQGVGIGLSVVKHIVEAHGGRVRVESAPGKGSRFTIELPMKTD